METWALKPDMAGRDKSYLSYINSRLIGKKVPTRNVATGIAIEGLWGWAFFFQQYLKTNKK